MQLAWLNLDRSKSCLELKFFYEKLRHVLVLLSHNIILQGRRVMALEAPVRLEVQPESQIWLQTQTRRFGQVRNWYHTQRICFGRMPPARLTFLPFVWPVCYRQLSHPLWKTTLLIPHFRFKRKFSKIPLIFFFKWHNSIIEIQAYLIKI